MIISRKRSASRRRHIDVDSQVVVAGRGGTHSAGLPSGRGQRSDQGHLLVVLRVAVFEGQEAVPGGGEDISFRGGHCVLRYHKKSRDQGDDWAIVPPTLDVLAVHRRYWAVRAARGEPRAGPQHRDGRAERPAVRIHPTPPPTRPDRRPRPQPETPPAQTADPRQPGSPPGARSLPSPPRPRVATLALEAGATLRQVQDLLGRLDRDDAA